MSTNHFSHVLPHDTALEQLVLGAMLLESAGLSTGLELLRSRKDVFYQPAHQVIFDAITALHREGQAVDIQTVALQLGKQGKLTKAGGPAAVAQLTMKVSGAANLATHCALLLELYTKRKIADTARALLAKAYDTMQDNFDLISHAQGQLNGLYDLLEMKRPRAIGELYDSVVDDIVHATEQAGGLTGVPSGLRVLDKLTGGFQNADLVILAARPGMGKTTLALSISRFAAGYGQPVAFFSLEMGERQLVRKLIATEAGYTTSQLQKGRLDGGRAEAEDIRQKAEALRQVGVFIDDTTSLSVSELRAKAEKLKAEQGIRMLVVDYLQLMKGDGYVGNREQEISSISRGLKKVAKELDLPVIALSQLSRSVESRGGEKRPMLSDLRESGAIEQDADMIIFPYRPEYYKIYEDDMGNSTRDTTELIVAKHRNGATADGDEALVVRSVMAKGRYSDLDDFEQADRALAEAKDALRKAPAAPDNRRLQPSGEFEDPNEDLPF